MENGAKFDFDLQNRILFKYYYGDIWMETIINTWKEALAEEIIPNNTVGFIIDYRKANICFNPERHAEVPDFYQANLDVFGNKRIAFVTDNPRDIVYPILFQSKDRGYTSQPFSTMEAAIRWVQFATEMVWVK